VYLHVNCLQKFIQPNISNFMSNMYKHLHSLTFTSCLLNKQQQTSTLIFVNKVQSVSYCSTVMLYAVFNFLCLMYCIKCDSQYITERTVSCGQSRYNFSSLGRKTTLTGHICIHHRAQYVPCYLL